MKKVSDKFIERRGFSLAEVLTALVIASMVLVTVLGIYSRAESVSATITRKLDNSRLPYEVLQLIAEDLDRIITTEASTRIIVSNKFDSGYSTAQLTITKTIMDAKKKPRIFENIVWQTSYDYESDSLILYRQRTSEIGLVEDKLLDEEKEKWEHAFFVPICVGITFFKIQAINGGEYLDKWSGRPPGGIEITISFAEPFETLDNSWDVYDEDKFIRTVAIDRSRRMKFKITEKPPEEIPGDQETTESPDDLEELTPFPDEPQDANNRRSPVPK